MILVDIHTHLDDKAFEKDLDRVIENARKAGIKTIINNGINPSTNRKTLELSKKYDIVKAALGIYPHEGLKMGDIEVEIEFIEQNKKNIRAIGEVGLDYLWSKGNIKQPKESFQKMIQLEEKINMQNIIY